MIDDIDRGKMAVCEIPEMEKDDKARRNTAPGIKGNKSFRHKISSLPRRYKSFFMSQQQSSLARYSIFHQRTNGRGKRIRTSGLYVPNVALYQAELYPDD